MLGIAVWIRLHLYSGLICNNIHIFISLRQKVRVWVMTGSAGGHFEEFELNDAKACVLREMNEELGIREDDIRNLSLRYVTLRRTKGEIRQNYYFFAILKEEVSDDLVSNEGELKWFSLNKLDELEMPYTARYVMEHYCSIGQYSDKIYSGVANQNEVSFLELPEF